MFKEAFPKLHKMHFLQPNNRLYHYCSLSTALEYILPNWQLRLSPLINTNDPRENQTFFFNHQSHISINDGLNGDIMGWNKKFSTDLRAGCKALCFSQDHKIYWGSLLSKMWAHYGGNHSGVCLEIDKNEFIKANSSKYDFNHFKEITYFSFDRSKPIEHKTVNHVTINDIGYENYLKQFRKENVDYLFFTKNDEWESECEVRLLHFGNKIEDEYCSIKSSIRNIHLGIKFHGSYLPAIQDLIKGSDIRIVNLAYGDVGLIFQPIP